MVSAFIRSFNRHLDIPRTIDTNTQTNRNEIPHYEQLAVAFRDNKLPALIDFNARKH